MCPLLVEYVYLLSPQSGTRPAPSWEVCEIQQTARKFKRNARNIKRKTAKRRVGQQHKGAEKWQHLLYKWQEGAEWQQNWPLSQNEKQNGSRISLILQNTATCRDNQAKCKRHQAKSNEKAMRICKNQRTSVKHQQISANISKQMKTKCKQNEQKSKDSLYTSPVAVNA